MYTNTHTHKYIYIYTRNVYTYMYKPIAIIAYVAYTAYSLASAVMYVCILRGYKPSVGLLSRNSTFSSCKSNRSGAAQDVLTAKCSNTK